MRRYPYVDRYDVLVTVSNDKVYLRGDVDSWYAKTLAGAAATLVPGVVEVANQLDIAGDVALKSDHEIKGDVESQLFWSPFVDSDDITVEVKDDVATLSGSAEDWDEVLSAKENAREGGAILVINRLTIENGSQVR